jgi:hypothetical protein
MLTHDKAHSNDLHRHFTGIDKQENKIDSFDIVRNSIHFLVQCKEHTVDNNNKEDESVEHRVDRHNLNNLISEWIGNREAAEGHSRIVLLSISVRLLVVLWKIWQLLFHLFNGLNSELAKSESSYILHFALLLLFPLTIEVFSLDRVCKVVLEFLLID